jgi:hypothetical protein
MTEMPAIHVCRNTIQNSQKMDSAKVSINILHWYIYIYIYIYIYMYVCIYIYINGIYIYIYMYVYIYIHQFIYIYMKHLLFSHKKNEVMSPIGKWTDWRLTC